MNPITGDDACLEMHTALRKTCDSHITSAMYSLVHLVDIKPHAYDPWRFYGKLVADYMNEGVAPVDALKRAHKDLDKFYALKIPSDLNATTWMVVLDCMMRLFDERDWQGMAAYLTQ